MYHRLYAHATELETWPHGITRYWVRIAEFERHMETLVNRGYSTVPLAVFLPEAPPVHVAKPLIITFDDGWESDYRYAHPILAKLGWRSEHFLTTGWCGRDEFLSWEQVRELAHDNAGIHSHSMTHPDFDSVPWPQVRHELKGSKDTLEAHIGRRIEFVALPGGSGAKASIRTLVRSLGYGGMCTSRVGLNRPGADPFQLRRIPVVDTTSVERLESWVTGNGLQTLALRHGAFRVARKCLGLRVYRWLRGQIV